MPLINVLVYGFFDSLNPCNLSGLVIFAAYLAWLRNRKLSFNQLGWIFIFTYVLALFAYSIGFFMNFLYSMEYFSFGRKYFTVLGVVLIVFGGIHFMDWVRIINRSSVLILPLTDDGKGKALNRTWGVLLTCFFAVILSALSTIWPPNKYISFYANYLAVPGEGLRSFIIISLYNLMLVVPMIVIFLLFPRTWSQGWVAKYASKTKVVMSAFLLGLGFCLVYVFH